MQYFCVVSFSVPQFLTDLFMNKCEKTSWLHRVVRSIHLCSICFLVQWDWRNTFYCEALRNNCSPWLVSSHLIRGMSLNWGLLKFDLISPVSGRSNHFLLPWQKGPWTSSAGAMTLIQQSSFGTDAAPDVNQHRASYNFNWSVQKALFVLQEEWISIYRSIYVDLNRQDNVL